MSFGFSAGDFFALTQLIFDVSKALSDSAGSKAEYQGLIQTLLSLLRSINSAEELALRCSLGSAAALEPSFVAPLNAIAREREICHKLIEAFMAKSEKYTASFIHGAGRAKAIKKLTWRLFHADDVQNLERELSVHVDAIQFYACGLGFQSLNASLASNTLILSKIDNRTASMYDIISQLMGIMPKVLGYPWEGGCSVDERPLRLLDALGRDLKIPAVFLGSREVFHDMLEIVHRNLPGHKKIKSKEYSIADEDAGGQVVQTDEDLQWSEVVRCGKTMSVNMIFQTYSHNKNSEKCPRCRSVTNGHTLEGKRRRCPVCQLTFHIFEEIRFEELKETPEQQPSQSAGESGASKKEKDTPEKVQQKKSRPKPVPKKPKEREQDIFRRIHYVHELIKRRGTVLRSSGCQKTDPNDGKYLDNLPPLHQAVAIGDLETVKRLLKERPGDIESEGGCDSATPLHYAAYQGRQDVAIFLIEHGARLDSRDTDGATPLHWSVPLGHLSMFRLLIESGADINSRSTKGRTPLHWCGWKNQPAIAKYILEEGFDVNVLDNNDLPPIADCEGDCSELIRLLVDEGADVNYSSVDQLTPLHITAEYGSVDAVRTLLEYGPDVNAVDNQNFTPLSLAMRREESSEEVCELLLSHGASVLGIDDGVPALIHEVVGRPSILRLLLSHGADTEARDAKGRTPLHNSIDMGEATTMAYLLDSGANIDATDDEGNTVLHFAMAQPNPDFARDLIAAGAEVNENNKSQNPLHWITLDSSGDTLRLLAGHGADIHAFDDRPMSPVVIAAEVGNAACLEVLIELGADASMEDDYQVCPIHFAAQSGHLLVIQTLLNAGVNVDCLADIERGRTSSLHLAANNNHHRVAGFLLEQGADPLISAEHLGTALHVAVTAGAIETARVLLEHATASEQLASTDSDHATALTLAVRKGHLALVKLLARHSANDQPVTFEDLVGDSPNAEFTEQMRLWFTELDDKETKGLT